MRRKVDGTAYTVGGARKPCPKHGVRACPAEVGSGALLRMGAEVVKAISESKDLTLSAQLDLGDSLD